PPRPHSDRAAGLDTRPIARHRPPHAAAHRKGLRSLGLVLVAAERDVATPSESTDDTDADRPEVGPEHLRVGADAKAKGAGNVAARHHDRLTLSACFRGAVSVDDEQRG